LKCVHKYWTVLKCKFGKALTPHGQKWEGSSFIFLQSNLPWLQYTFYSFLKAVVHNHWKHPKELYFIWQFHPSSCSWCPVIVIIWRQFSLEGTGKSGLASGQVIKEGGWSPPGCDSPRSALLSWQNDQGIFVQKEPSAFFTKSWPHTLKSPWIAFLALVHTIHSPKIFSASHPVYQNSDHHLQL